MSRYAAGCSPSCSIVATAAFAFYVGSFDLLHGPMAHSLGPVIFLVWLSISTSPSSSAGAQRRARGVRRIEAGHPADVEPFVEPRDTRKFSDREKREVKQ